jgi:hypothetical protein
MDNESDKYVLFSTIFGILLTISEILPYIKMIKSNGILEFILETCFLLLKKCKSYDDRQNDDASERLLEDLIDNNRISNINEDVSNINGDISNVSNVKKCLTITFDDRRQGTSENITITFNSPREIKIS